MDIESLLARYQTPHEKVGTNVLEDVELLKSIDEYPAHLDPPLWNYYVEPIEVEYYAPKLGSFVPSTKYLFVELFEPDVEHPNHIEIHDQFKSLDLPIDMVQVMDHFPKYTVSILENYGELIGIHERISLEIKNGLDGDIHSILRALYLTEVVRKREPTLAVFEILGNYTHYNLNWFIRYLNKKDVTFSLEDSTVHYLLKVFIAEKEEKQEAVPERFNILKNIFLEQAFPALEIDEEE